MLVELAALAMPHARLSFEVASADLGPTGADRVDLMFAANPGSELRSLGEGASGGELSRVRLALEVVLAADREAVTLVFDEIDAGVGGKVAVEVGTGSRGCHSTVRSSSSPTSRRSPLSRIGTTWW